MRFACLCFCTLHTNEIPRTDPLVQVDYVRVVDLDTGASKSDICAIRVVTILARAGRHEPATAVSAETGMANFGLRVVLRLIAKNNRSPPFSSRFAIHPRPFDRLLATALEIF